MDVRVFINNMEPDDVVNIELNRHNPSPITAAVLYYILLSFRYDQENRKVTRFYCGHCSNGITTAY